MNNIHHTLFHVLRGAVNGGPLKKDLFAGLSPADWDSLYVLSREQGLTAVVFDTLSGVYQRDASFPRMPKPLTLKWYAQAEHIKGNMQRLKDKSGALARTLAASGLHVMVLKGIAVSRYYPEPLWREFGDLDCYVFRTEGGRPVWESGFEPGNVALEKAGADVRREHYKHSFITYQGMSVENHQFFLAVRGSRAYKALERHLRTLVEKSGGLQPLSGADESGLYTPGPDFNALFLTAHAMGHFLHESVKLRHVLDWALFLRAEGEHVDWPLFWTWCERMHYTRFVFLMNHLCASLLGVSVPQPASGSTAMTGADTERLSARLLDDILYGNRVYTSDASPMQRRMRLVGNFFASSWKYRQVADTCMFAELLRQATAPLWDRNPKL